MNDLRDRLLAAFLTEHRDYLTGLRADLDRLEQAGTATGAELEETFRRAHSLKAAARVCDFRTVEQIGQRLETLFAQVRKGTRRLDRPALDGVRAVLTAVEEWANALADRRAVPEPAPALASLDQLLSGTPASAPRPAPSDDLTGKLLAAFQIEHREHLEGIRLILAGAQEGKPLPGDSVDEAFRRAHSLKGAARLAELRPAETLAHRLETLFARVREGTLQLNGNVVRVISQGLDAIEDWAASLLEHKKAPDSAGTLEAIDRLLGTRVPGSEVAREPPAQAALAAAPQFASVETVRVSADNLDRMLRSTGQLLTENLRQNLVTRELAGLGHDIEAMSREWEALRSTAAGALRQLAATPGLARIAHFVDLVEHQVRRLARRARTVRVLQQRSSWTLGLLGGQLQQDARRVRMVSAESVFQGFRKMMRDLARDEGKEIDFRVSGFEIEADRMVLQALKDPLMHMLCNAVSHGIEGQEERVRQGKSPPGRVALHLEAVGNRLRILVEDDGRGIDHQQVAAVAVERGFLTGAEAGAATPEELARLVFRPGFSTARTVTGLSGRGMGLSVVHEAAARLQGEVELGPGETHGTRLVLTVPLSIATQRLLLVRCQAQTFALPVHAIEQLLRIKLEDVETVEGKPMLLVAGQPVPLLTLAHLLKMNGGDLSLPGAFVPVLIVRSAGQRVALAVDAFLAERDSLINDLDEPAVRVTTLAGGILQDDGSVALVLNPAELLKSFRPSDKVPVLRTMAAVPEKKTSTILVVDDSLTTRTLEKSLLEAHGYAVRIAMDGVEALAQLQEELPDLVITDLQMPRMDGFKLLEAMKHDRRLAEIPVIVVTSMERREDQERGLALGADAYIVKRKFDHQELLDTIRQII